MTQMIKHARGTSWYLKAEMDKILLACRTGLMRAVPLLKSEGDLQKLLNLLNQKIIKVGINRIQVKLSRNTASWADKLGRQKPLQRSLERSPPRARRNPEPRKKIQKRQLVKVKKKDREGGKERGRQVQSPSPMPQQKRKEEQRQRQSRKPQRRERQRERQVLRQREKEEPRQRQTKRQRRMPQQRQKAEVKRHQRHRQRHRQRQRRRRRRR